MSDMGSAGEQQFCLRWNNHQANFVQAFECLLEEETFADVTLAVEGLVLKCHKMVLAACSTYFKTLFSNVPCSHPVVFLKDVKVNEIRAILEYVYKGEVNVARNELAAMLKVAEMLQIKGLMNTDTGLPPVERETPERPMDEEEAISTSTTGHRGISVSGMTSGCDDQHSSPPHSTSSPYYGYGKSTDERNDNGTRFPLPVWAMSQGIPLVRQNPAAMSAALHPALVARHASIFGGLYEHSNSTVGHQNRKNKMGAGTMMRNNHDTPILRGVLGQVHADSSQTHQQLSSDGPESHYRSHSNGSADNCSDDRRSSVDLSIGNTAHSTYPTGSSVIDDDDKKHSPRSLTDDKKQAIANYVPSQKPEWKRYKQYTRADIANAIAAVRGGLSALQAARKYGVPSRTLYDKVKKLGITTSRPGRRATNGSGACFPYGVGGNVNGNIYNNTTDNDNDNGGTIMDNSSTAMETSYPGSRDNSMDRDTTIDQTRSPSPPLALCYQSSTMHHQQQQHHHHRPEESPDQDSDNEVEDLSVNRRSDVRVIMPPSVTIKEEA